jgi:tRNA (adenine57-N1/adenine58-N1)-methyltransferase
VSAERRQSGPFRAGDRVQLTGPKGRLNTITLEPGKVFHTHRGMVEHDSLIGVPDASVITASNGDEYLALRPLLGDIFPGAHVVEAGVGSGALSLWLLRGIGPTGSLLSFERRDEFAQVARANVVSFLGAAPENWMVTVGDLVESLPTAVEDGSIDRVVLDMLAPWECLDVVADALTPGGVLLCYIATVTQLSRVAEAIRGTGAFTDPDSSETMIRGWHVEGLAVRPDHRMVAHTGFLLTARRLAPGTTLPQLKRRPSKSDYTDEDVEAWTPGALGERVVTDKRLRKTARAAQATAERAVEASDNP